MNFLIGWLNVSCKIQHLIQKSYPWLKLTLNIFVFWMFWGCLGCFERCKYQCWVLLNYRSIPKLPRLTDFQKNRIHAVKYSVPTHMRTFVCKWMRLSVVECVGKCAISAFEWNECRLLSNSKAKTLPILTITAKAWNIDVLVLKLNAFQNPFKTVESTQKLWLVKYYFSPEISLLIQILLTENTQNKLKNQNCELTAVVLFNKMDFKHCKIKAFHFERLPHIDYKIVADYFPMWCRIMLMGNHECYMLMASIPCNCHAYREIYFCSILRSTDRGNLNNVRRNKCF